MKTFSKYIGLLLVLAIAGGVAYLFLHPDASEALQNKLDSYGAEETEAVEVTPVRELKVAYAFPEALQQEIDDTYQCKPEWLHQLVFTYFKDLGGDLWLPFTEQADDRVFAALLCNQSGEIVGRAAKDEGSCDGDGVSGELRISGGVLADLPEGDYWLAVLYTNDSQNGGLRYYLSVHDRCTFHTEDYTTTAGARTREVLIDRTPEDGYDIHLCNLGDNRVVGLWEMTDDDFVGYRYNKVDEKYFTVSGNGSTVTLTKAYLDTLKPLYAYHFRFTLADGTLFDTTQNRLWDSRAFVVFHDGSLNLPSVEGPETYSLSSGKDFTFSYHMGDALNLYAVDVIFLNPDPQPGQEHESTAPLPVDGLEERDGTITVPASLLKEGAERGIQSIWISATFQMSDHRMHSYWRGTGFGADFVP